MGVMEKVLAAGEKADGKAESLPASAWEAAKKMKQHSINEIRVLGLLLIPALYKNIVWHLKNLLTHVQEYYEKIIIKFNYSIF
jgi:hypothetical protein